MKREWTGGEARGSSRRGGRENWLQCKIKKQKQGKGERKRKENAKNGADHSAGYLAYCKEG